MVAVISEPTPNPVDEAWQGIADLKLRPGRALHFYQHHYRGQAWLIIADQQNESYFRCSADAEHFLGLLDGSRTVEQALFETRQSHSASLQQPDIVLLIGNMKAAGLLQDDAVPDANDNPLAPKPKANPWLRPFAIKFALFDPDRFLQRTVHYFRPFFHPVALLFWLGFVVLALITGWLHWQELAEHSAARFADPKNLLWYWLLYPLVKGLHELGHAYATRVWGGVVHEMGIMLLVFFPVPYVDSSAAHRFSSKNRRLLVSAAGIMVEMLVAALALLLWVNTDHGLLHDLAFDIVLIGGVSTLLFNANPLLRFDGYYIFSELIEIPNLGTRSNQYLGYLLKRFILDIPGMRSPVTAQGETKWLFVYGVCSSIYRVFISLFIAFWIAGKFFIIGILLAVWAVVMQIIYPAAQNLLRLIPVVMQAHRLRRFGAVVIGFFLIALAGLLVPTGHSTYSEGVVSLSENALIRAGADGIVSEVLLADGEPVDVGATVLKLENMLLETRRETLLARLDETRARQQQVFLQDRSQADILKIKVSSLEADLKDTENQLNSLDVVTAAQGVVSLPMASDLPHRFVNRGDVIGYVAGPGPVTAMVVIPQMDIDVVRRNTESIEVRLSGRPGETLSADYLRELPQGTDQLPNRRLGSGAGGDVAIDSRDETGVQVLSNVFLVEIGLPLKIAGHFPGQRIYVRFNHHRESWGNRLLRRLDQLMLQAPFV